MDSKTCNSCLVTKEVSEFYKRPDKGTYRPYCKPCHNKKTAAGSTARQTKYYNDNPHMRCKSSSSRRARERNCKPSWLTQEMDDQITALYHQAKTLEDETGVKYHVDHIVPLAGSNVSGLHVPWNLRVIPASENLKKGNRFNG